MRLKTLKELVDEFGDRLVISEYSGDQFFRLLERVGLIPVEMLNENKPDIDILRMPAWATKGPKKKKLYAYTDGNNEVREFTNNNYPEQLNNFTRADEWDREIE